MFLVLVKTDAAGVQRCLPRFSTVTPLTAEQLELGSDHRPATGAVIQRRTHDPIRPDRALPATNTAAGARRLASPRRVARLPSVKIA